MKKLCIALALLSLINPAQSALPDIGDNSIFECIEYVDPEDSTMCYGDINWITDKNGDAREEKTVYPKKAKKKI